MKGRITLVVAGVWLQGVGGQQKKVKARQRRGEGRPLRASPRAVMVKVRHRWRVHVLCAAMSEAKCVQ